MRPGQLAAIAVAVGTLASCSSGGPCDAAAAVPHGTPSSAGCHDLVFKDVSYDEWRAVATPRLPQELGDATYPACNDTSSCDGQDLGGYGATDVWLVDGVEPAEAVLGLREGTEIRVVFVAVGVDPASLEDRIDPWVLRES